MRLHVVYDAKGNIIALGHVSAEPEAFDAPRSGPQAGEGQSVAEIDVLDEHAGLTLVELHDRLRVDVKASRPKWMPLER